MGTDRKHRKARTEQRTTIESVCLQGPSTDKYRARERLDAAAKLSLTASRPKVWPLNVPVRLQRTLVRLPRGNGGKGDSQPDPFRIFTRPRRFTPIRAPLSCESRSSRAH